MPKANETVVLEGTVLRKFPTEYIAGKFGKQVAKTNFILKTLDGKEHKVTKFGKIESELLGEDARFEASYNSQYNNYTVQGEIEAAELVGTPVEVKEQVVEGYGPTGNKVVTRRGRPAKKTASVTPSAPTAVAVNEDLAITLVRTNLQDSVSLLNSLGYNNPDTTQVVTVADMIGRTRVALRIEAGKDNRMANFRR